MNEKLMKLSPELRAKIFSEKRDFVPSEDTPVSNFLVRTKRHCNGGRTVDAGLMLKKHCDEGGKLFVTMSGAASSFEMGVVLADLIKADKVAGISVTGANLEESLYRLVANSHYAYIPDYQSLTRQEEKELERAGYRRITDTFLPEDESVRIVLPKLEQLWREAEEKGERYFWHEYFFQLFERNMIEFDPTADPEECWLYQAWKHGVQIFVPGIEDQTMGNIFTYYCYEGNHPILSRYRQAKPISRNVVKHSFEYMHYLSEWYLNYTPKMPLAFLQLGGGIAGDFPICAVPHLKKDFFADETDEVQEQMVRPWAGFVEIHSSPMSYGSYSGAGLNEKITWGKFEIDAFGVQIFGDYTEHFPDIVAIILRW